MAISLTIFTSVVDARTGAQQQRSNLGAASTSAGGPLSRAKRAIHVKRFICPSNCHNIVESSFSIAVASKITQNSFAAMNEMKNAIKSNDIATVKSLLVDGSVDVNARVADILNSPLLVLAADLGRVEIVALLLDAGAKIDAVNDHGETACHGAVRHNRTAVVELLVARNANVSLRNRGNATPVLIAIDRKNERLVMLLIDAAMASGTPLDNKTICLVATVSADVIRCLLFKHRINLSGIRDSNGLTALHRAVWRTRDPGVLDARDRNGSTAAHIACRMQDAGALVRLIAAGANVGLADENGETPFHYCMYDSTDQVACCLLAAGVNVHAKADNGRTACHRACLWSHASLPALVAFGSNLDEPDDDGVTPRQLLKSAPPTSEQIEAARGRVLNVQLSFVRKRAFDVCIGLQSLRFDALCMCEILLHSCGPVAPFVPFHHWWQIATTVKHFQQ